jgi:hypothetical protein
LLLKESEGVHKFFGVHVLDGGSVLHLGDLSLGFLFEVFIRKLDDLKELPSDEAAGSTASLKLKENVEVFFGWLDGESLLPPFKTVLEGVFSESESLEYVIFTASSFFLSFLLFFFRFLGVELVGVFLLDFLDLLFSVFSSNDGTSFGILITSSRNS